MRLHMEKIPVFSRPVKGHQNFSESENGSIPISWQFWIFALFWRLRFLFVVGHVLPTRETPLALACLFDTKLKLYSLVCFSSLSNTIDNKIIFIYKKATIKNTCTKWLKYRSGAPISMKFFSKIL